MAQRLRLRAIVLADPIGQRRSSGYSVGFQFPVLPERQRFGTAPSGLARSLLVVGGPRVLAGSSPASSSTPQVGRWAVRRDRGRLAAQIERFQPIGNRRKPSSNVP